MNRKKSRLNKIIFSLYYKRHLLFFLASILALLLVSLKLINIDSILGFQSNRLIYSLFNFILLISTAFILLLLPFYPLYYLILQEKGFNFLEKGSLTIISNLTFYILTGYIGNFFKIPLTGLYFVFLIVIVYLILVGITIFKRSIAIFLKPDNDLENKQNPAEFSIYRYIKSKIPLNSWLVVVFLILLSILHGVRFSYFYGTDAMYHVFMAKMINYLNYLPVEQYFGALGLHLFTAIIHFFTGIDHLFLAKYFSFYTFFASGLIIYNILKRIFKNRNLALLGVFSLEFTSLGFSNMMYQFWPTALATIQLLHIFFLLYVRLLNFINQEKPTKKTIISNLALTYILVILIYISALFTHSLIATIFFVSFAFVFLIYFAKNYKRGFDFLLIVICLGLFLALFNFSEISSHWKITNIFYLPWYILVAAGIIGVLLVLKLRSDLKFTKGTFTSVIKGEKYKYYKKIEDKFLFPLFFSVIAVFIISFLFLNLFAFNLQFSKTLVAIECFIMIFFGIWGLSLFQKKPRGKPLMLWLFGLVIIYLAALSLDVFVLNQFWSGRILLLFSPIIIFGFISYLYKLIKLNSFGKLKFKILLLSIVIFTFFSQFSDQILDFDDIEYSLHRREVYSLRWYSNYTSDPNFIICEFGIPYVVMYYTYPFEERNKSILVKDLLDFEHSPKGYFKPDDHFFNNGTNKLQQLKNNLGTDVYLILDDNYLALSGFDIYERLSEEEMEEYYAMNYLNKVCSSKSVDGIELPYFWVI